MRTAAQCQARPAPAPSADNSKRRDDAGPGSVRVGLMPDALAAAYDVLLLDLDGVVYIGAKPIPGAPEALQRAKQAGVHLAYVTNNASRTPAAVAGLLASMGAPATADDVVTSAQAAARLLADKLPPKSKVLVLGALALRLAISERGLIPGSNAAAN